MKCSTGYNLKNGRNISAYFQGKLINSTVIHVYVLINNAEVEIEVKVSGKLKLSASMFTYDNF